MLQNARKHGIPISKGRPDPYCPAPWFRFWRERTAAPAIPSPVVAAAGLQNQWLTAVLGVGLALDDVPASG